MNGEIILGDAFDVIKNIENRSVDLILTDPPYNISKQSCFNKSDYHFKFSQMIHDFGEWDHNEIDIYALFKEFYRVLRKGGTVIMFYDIWKADLVKAAAEKANFKQPRIGQWLKNNPVPINSKRNYLSNASEYFFMFVKSGKPTFKSEYDNAIYRHALCHGHERTKHTTQKPLNLFKELIEKHSNVDDLVLDTFSGSGTTAVACEHLNRRYICVEKNKEYFDISNTRLNNMFTDTYKEKNNN